MIVDAVDGGAAGPSELNLESFEEVEVACDRLALGIVLSNLLSNAAKFSKQSPIRHISVRAFVGARRVRLEIEDSGPGVPADILKRVFEPFFTTKPEGIGLGLSIAHTIDERAGGAISAENRPMGGAVFRFSLPAATARPAKSDAGRQASGPAAADAGRPPLSRAAG